MSPAKVSVAQTAVLHAENLTRSFTGQASSKPAVHNLSFTLQPGEIVGLLGPNGAGKSTTLRLLTGVLRPDAGSVTIAGHNLATARGQALGQLGYLSEQTAPLVQHLAQLNAHEYFKFITRAYALKTSQTNSIPATTPPIAAAMAGCENLLNIPLGHLSKGQRQRVFFAATLLHDPAVLILDEPTDGLDPGQQQALHGTLKTLASKHNKAVLFSTHQLADAATLCTRLLVINEGQLVADTTPADVLKKGGMNTLFDNLTTNKR